MSNFLALNKSLNEVARLRMISESADAVNIGINTPPVAYADKHLTIGLGPSKEALPTITTSIKRFAPKYWYIDGPNTASFAITSYGNGFEATFQCRTSADLIGIAWDSENVLDHKYLSYDVDKDYSGLVWDFDIELSDSMPALNDMSLAPTLTVHYEDDEGRIGIAYVALANYATTPDSRKSHITIDFDNVRGGAGNTAQFNVKAITKMFFGGYTKNYNKGTVTNFDEPEAGYLRVTNSEVSGSGTDMRSKRICTGKHNVGMSTSYDDHYNLNPQRVVDNLRELGYQGLVNHYCGMSHYPAIFWNKELGRFLIPDVTETPDVAVVNPCTRLWHEKFAAALHEAGMTPVFSVSWELYSQGAREEWCQRDFNDNIARTGYEPPSYFASLCNDKAIAYLQQAYREMGDAMVAGGCEVKLQIGEPWHWFNVATQMPCVYDYQTRLAFNADTGLYAPDLGTIIEAMDKTDETSEAFKDWLRDKLGQTCRDYRTFIKTQFGDKAEVCPLIFFPSILTHTPSLATYINYPVEHYSYPNFDFIMTEAYDWVIEQPPRLDLSHNAVDEIPIKQLGYPAEKVAYLSGFVPDKMIAYIYKLDHTTNYRAPIWQRIFGDMKNNQSAGIMKQHVWAYPQVMQDSITIANDGFFFDEKYYPPISDNTPYPAEIFGEDLQPYAEPPLTKPRSIRLLSNWFGDYTVAFGVDNPIMDDSFEVQLLDDSGLSSVWTKRIWTRQTSLSRSLLKNLGADKDTLKVLVLPEHGLPSDIIDVNVEQDYSYVAMGLVVAGQSHAAAHFTELGINPESPNHLSAELMRDTFAGEDWDRETIAPLNLGFGSSAADKLAQVDGSIDGDNYWYDLDNDQPGPLLTQALETIDNILASGKAVHNEFTLRMFWTQGGADADAHAVGGEFTSTVERYIAATNKVLDALSAKLDGEPIVTQLIGRKYAGDVEINGVSRKLYRDAQIELIKSRDDLILGTWTNGSEKPEGYILESGFRGHYIPEVYRQVAVDVGSALSTGIDLLEGNIPAWLSYDVVKDVEIVHAENGEDIVTTWNPGNYVKFVVKQIDVLTGEEIYSVETEEATDTFAADLQRERYEYTAGSVIVKIIGYDLNGVAGVLTEVRKSFS